MSFGSMRTRAKSFGALSALMVIVPLLLVSCGGSSSAAQHTLISIPSVGGALVENFSPYNVNANPGTIGIMYEPLEYVNELNGKVTPVLATGAQYSSDD